MRTENAAVIIKGLRVVSDFESEMSTALMNRALSDVDTMFLMSDQRYSFVSSSIVKEVFFWRRRWRAGAGSGDAAHGG